LPQRVEKKKYWKALVKKRAKERKALAKEMYDACIGVLKD